MDYRVAIIVLMLALSSCLPQNLVVNEATGPAGRHDKVIENAGSFLVAYHAAHRGDVEQAARQYTNALTDDPDNINLLERSFRSLYLDGQIESAAAVAGKLEQQGKLISLGNEPVAALTARAEDWPGLEAVARRLNEDDASRRLAIVLEAWALAFQRQGDAGLSRLLDLADDNNAYAARQLMLGQTAAMMDYLGRSGYAIAQARTTLEQPELTVGTILSMASILARNGATKDAARVIRTHLSPPFAKDRITSGIASGRSTLMDAPDQSDLLVAAVIATGQSDRAASISFLARLQLAAHIDPDHDLLRYHLGNLLQQIGKVEEGLDQYRRIRLHSPWYEPTMLFMALRLNRIENDFDASSALFRKILKVNPENPEIWHYFGDAARWNGDHEHALSHYEKAITYGGDRAKLEYKRGITLDSLGHYREAEAALRRSVTLDTTDAHALNYLGYWMLEHGGNAQEALSLIRIAVNAHPKNGSFVDSLGWGYYRLGQYKRAVRLLEHAVVLRPSDPVITDHLGDAYHKAGRLREAVYQWQRALVSPEDGVVDRAAITDKIESLEALINP